MALNPTGIGAPVVGPVTGLVTLMHFSAAFFVLTLVTDFAYMRTSVLMWQDFSSWLLFFGLVVGALATVLWLVGMAIRRHRPMWGVVLLYALVLVVAFINSLVHAADGWTAVVPWGIGLSALACLILLAAAFAGTRLGPRHTLQAF